MQVEKAERVRLRSLETALGYFSSDGQGLFSQFTVCVIALLFGQSRCDLCLTHIM